MSDRWYEHWLRKADEAERHGNRAAAVVFLDKAEKHTFDPDELYYLNLWRHRLRESLETNP